ADVHSRPGVRGALDRLHGLDLLRRGELEEVRPASASSVRRCGLATRERPDGLGVLGQRDAGTALGPAPVTGHDLAAQVDGERIADALALGADGDAPAGRVRVHAVEHGAVADVTVGRHLPDLDRAGVVGRQAGEIAQIREFPGIAVYGPLPRGRAQAHAGDRVQPDLELTAQVLE